MTAALSVGAMVAIGATAAVGAGATIYAANESADATKNATNSAIAANKQALTSQQALEQPFTTAGTNALPQLQKLLGINPDGSPATGANSQQQQQTLASMPGYQFDLNQGLNATKNAATASGLSMSGNTLQALDQFSTGLADNTYQSEVGNLQSLVNTGQAGASGQAANIGSTAANNSALTVNQGNNTAAIDANEIAGITKATGAAGNQYTMNQTLSDIYGTGGGSFSPSFDASLGNALGVGNSPINTSLVTP